MKGSKYRKMFAPWAKKARALVKDNGVLEGEVCYIENNARILFDDFDGVESVWVGLRRVMATKGLHLHWWAEDAQEFRWLVTSKVIDRNTARRVLHARTFLAMLKDESEDDCESFIFQLEESRLVTKTDLETLETLYEQRSKVDAAALA